MPLPATLLEAAREIRIAVVPLGRWHEQAWEGEGSHLPLWVIPIEPLAGEGETTELVSMSDLAHRLSQAGITWKDAQISLGDRLVPGVALEGTTRSKAVALGYRLGLWAVLRVGEHRLTVVYTGKGSRL